jgi:peptidoglycan hydrolase-like protein with peptidoglycan-binding domain
MTLATAARRPPSTPGFKLEAPVQDDRSRGRQTLRRELGSLDFATAEARLRPDGAGASTGPLSPAALREARGYHERRKSALGPEVVAAVGMRLGLGGLRAWTDDALQALASWQRSEGLGVDGKFGPNTMGRMFPHGLPKVVEAPRATLGPRALADARAFWKARADKFDPVLVSRIGVAVGHGPSVAVTSELLHAVAAWQRKAGLDAAGKFGRRTAEAMFPGEDVLRVRGAGGPPSNAEGGEQVVRPDAILGPRALAEARAWFAARGATFPPARIEAIAAALPGGLAPVLDDALIQGIGAWQKRSGLGIDGKPGPVSARRLLPGELAGGASNPGARVIATGGGEKEQKALAIISALEARGRYGLLNLWGQGHRLARDPPGDPDLRQPRRSPRPLPRQGPRQRPGRRLEAPPAAHRELPGQPGRHPLRRERGRPRP